MEQNNQQQSFWQFSDQLRLQTAAATLANFSTNDSIWSNSYASTRKNSNFDVRVGAELSSSNSRPKLSSDLNVFNDGWNSFKPSAGGSDLLSLKPLGSGHPKEAVANDGWNSFKPKISSDYINGFNDGWKMNNNNGPMIMGNNSKEIGVNTGGHYSKGLYYKLGNTTPANNGNFNVKSYRNGGGGKGEEVEYGGGKGGKKGGNNNKVKSGGVENGGDGGKCGAAEKRFKTLPAAESLPRNETIGGYIFVCNNDTMQENLRRQLFGLPPRYRDSVRAITPGLPLFLYNYSTHQLHGIFEAASFGGTNIDPTAWEDKKCLGESRFPAQVKVITRKICEPLEEDSFRPILHHYDGPKFRLELSIPEAISLLDVLAHQNP